MKLFFNRKESGQVATDEMVLVDQMLDDVQQEICHAEVAAAITLALHMYMKHLKDYEKTVLTFQKIMKPYSPWSAKMYGMRQQPLFMPHLKVKTK